jgi:hypothetical protein
MQCLLSLLCLHRLTSNLIERRRSLSFRVQQLLSSLAGVYLATRLGVTAQRLATMGASPPPMPLPGQLSSTSSDRSVSQLLTADPLPPTSLHTDSDSDSEPESESESESELLYDWRFTANQFSLASSPLRPQPVYFFQLNPCGCSPYVTFSLTRGWVCRCPLLLVPASAAFLGSESRVTHDHSTLT